MKNLGETLIKRKGGLTPVDGLGNLVTVVAVIEIVRESDSVSFCHRQDFMFAITVERRPLHGGRVVAPIECHLTTVMTDRQFSTLMRRGETNKQRSKLIFSTRGIDMRFKFVMRTLIDLAVRTIPFGQGVYVEFVKFCDNDGFQRTEID